MIAIESRFRARIHHKGAENSKLEMDFLSWRQLDGKRRLTPPPGPNERQTPNSEATGGRPANSMSRIEDDDECDWFKTPNLEPGTPNSKLIPQESAEELRRGF